ncbi:MAG: AbrB/MazE/SpoVT family DNA-binding domain-containing protein [Clostridia bacterium]|nr:AbrB/MazE/SpoVT family DNA-binding domain-containing protein [Clostridia bacterium]
MKKSGDLCKLDSLGRIVIPVRLRRSLDLNINDALEVYTDGDEIILKKYIPVCVFCGSDDELTVYKNKCVCRNCANEIGK